MGGRSYAALLLSFFTSAMSLHRATIVWARTTESFAYEDYDRNHVWRFEEGVEVPASATPRFLGEAGRVDPESAFVAALSSCHMLTFLAIAARRRFIVDAYEDHAEGVLGEDAEGQLAMTRVVLRPRVTFGGERRPRAEDVDRMHRLAHEGCFIARSVRTEVVVEPA